MRFGVLGPLAVWTDQGEPVTIPGRKVRAVLADLLVHEGRPVSVDRLVEDVWGDAAPADPTAALHVRVSQLRRALAAAEPGGRDLVVSQAPGYAIAAGPEAVDAKRFATLVGQAQGAHAPRTRARLLADALGLWRGPALADFADEEFAAASRARWEEQRLAALEAHAEARLDAGEHRELVGELSEEVARHPFRERLRAAQMRALHRAVLAGDPSEDAPQAAPQPALPTTNLPAPVTELIGRDHAVQRVRDLLATGRLVTLTGPGGVGKTSVAVAVARSMVETYPDGVWLVDLTTWESGDPADLVLSVLSIPDAPGGPEPAGRRLAAVLRERQVLLVLDNCEHLAGPVAELVGALLPAAPGLRVLATSREPLRLRGEDRWELPPLDIPDTDDRVRLARASAVRLFLARAGLEPDPEPGTAAGVAEVCRRLDGIPLALELAATRVPALGVAELAARLRVPQDRFGLLGSGPRDAPARQRTLAAVLDWSWNLLSGPERAVLRPLAVHSGGCTLDAAGAVCAGGGAAPDEVLDLLAGLVDRSLVVRVERDGATRFRLLESVSAYCLDRLRDAGEQAALRRRHADYYLGLAERAEPSLRGPDQREWLQRLDVEAANLRTALDTFRREHAAGPALRLAGALLWYWFLRGRLGEARRALAEALAVQSPPAVQERAELVALRAAAEAWDAGLAIRQGRAGPERVAEVLPRLARVADPVERARAEWFLASAAINFGDHSTTADLLTHAGDAFQAAGHRWGEAAVLSTRAMLAHMRGDREALEHDARRSAELFGELGDDWGVLQAADWLVGLADMTGDYAEAFRLGRANLANAEKLGLWSDRAGQMGWLAWLSVQVADYPEAFAYGQQAKRLAAELGEQTGEVLATIGLGFAARRDGRLDLAEEHLRWLLASARQQQAGAGHPPYLPMVLVELGFLAEQRGDAAAALAWHRESFDVQRQDGTVDGLAWALAGLAAALLRDRRPGVAAQLLGAADAARRRVGRRPSISECDELARITTAVRDAEPDFDAWYARGAALTPEQARSLVDGDRA